MDKSYLYEAFQAMNLLEDTFQLDDEGVKDILDFQSKDELNDIVDVFDPEAEDTEELQDSYIGDVILECEVCHSPIFKKIEEVNVDEDSDMANIEDECPICHSNDGFKIIGTVAPFEQDPELDIEVEDKPVEDEVEITDTEDEDDIDESCETDESVSDIKAKLNRFAKKHMKESMSAKNADIPGGTKRPTPGTGKKVDWKNRQKETRYAIVDKDGKTIAKYDSKTDAQADIEAFKKEDKKNHVNKSYSIKELSESLNEGHADFVKKLYADRLYGHSQELDDTDEDNSFIDDMPMLIDYEETPDTITLKFDKPLDANDLEQYLMYTDATEDEIATAKLVAPDTVVMTNIINESLNEGWKDFDFDDYDDDKVVTVVITDKRFSPITEPWQREILSDNNVKVDTCYLNGVVVEGKVKDIAQVCIDCRVMSPDKIYESIESLDEGLEKVDLETEDKIIHVSEEDKEPVADAEMITPVSPEVEAELMDNDEVDDTSDEPVEDTEEPIDEPVEDDEEPVEEEPEDDMIDYDIDDFEEDDFDELGESYLKKVYENVNSFKTSSVALKNDKLIVEGVIAFNSGKQKSTTFIFEAKDATKTGKVRFIGENKQISRGKKSFTLAGSINNGKFIAESLNYNYRAKTADGNSTRLYGTVKLD